MTPEETQDLVNRHTKKVAYSPEKKVDGQVMSFLFQIKAFNKEHGLTEEDMSVLDDFQFDDIEHVLVERAFYDACQEIRKQFATGNFNATLAAKLYLKIDEVEDQVREEQMTHWFNKLSDKGKAAFLKGQSEIIQRKGHAGSRTDWVSMAGEAPEYVLSRLLQACDRWRTMGSSK